ncbi:uncharacterized protein B0I36DRAFT_337944 [Microdochium trichocladiopsis]|uniref:F-box domain-containing protein n=1 Tax=Microdochium trichocladiopsis TaxID=1682393 RepID=A0A9P8XTL3_9PEZI|nr:uncharacterized protein B0I36DRAFT_337944 [Microdochium trichocladiopsis]KAH7016516.1 hypothetical protein B0I36DRAFT_337944 [Microdochium trichocladiopsis]
MGADMYCAICCGPFGNATVGVGRWTYIWRQHHLRQPWDLEPVHPQHLPGAADTGHHCGEGSAVETSQEDSGEDYNYDPHVILDEVEHGQVRWVCDVYLLGFDGSRAAFFGPGSHEDFSFVNMDAELDPFGNAQESWECYTDTMQQDPCYPFHKPCYDVLARALTGKKQMTDAEVDRLYHVMRKLGEDCGVSLDLDYRLDGQEYEQFWVVQRGKEYTVTSPAESPAVSAHLQSVLQLERFRCSSGDAATVPMPRGQDLFQTLPPEILHSVAAYLDNDQLLQLLTASRHASAAIRHDNWFWGLRIQSTMAWFFELLDYLDQADSGAVSDFDLKRVFVWANGISRGHVGMKGLFMVVANRRRIWETSCAAIRQEYGTTL